MLDFGLTGRVPKSDMWGKDVVIHAMAKNFALSHSVEMELGDSFFGPSEAYSRDSSEGLL